MFIEVRMKIIVNITGGGHTADYATGRCGVGGPGSVANRAAEKVQSLFY